MIDFNDSRISEDGKKIILDINIKDIEYYDNMYIERVVIDSHDTFTPSGPSSNFIYEWEDPSPIIVNGQLVNRRFLRLELSSSDIDGISLNNNMFYIYVIAGGIPSPNTPCGMDNKISMRVVFDYGPIYRNSIYFFNELSKQCDTPQGLINQILQLNALELSLITRHYTQANKFWNKFFKNNKSNISSNNCRCNG